LGVENTNVWYHPATADGDIFEPLDRYFENPWSLTDEEGVPVFITFPSLKDQTYEQENPGKFTCQILCMAKWEWFEKWENVCWTTPSRAHPFTFTFPVLPLASLV
jgi:hypothetical protein